MRTRTKRQKTKSRRKRSPSVGDEEQRLLKACDQHSNPFLGWIVRIALYTDMRQGEIILLKRNHVNLERSTVFLPDAKNNEVRNVPLTNKAKEVFRQVMEHPVRPIDSDLLFFGEPGRDGKRRPYTINRMWAEALKRA